MNKLIFSLIIAGIIIYVVIIGLHREIANGEHTGYITSVEQTGLIFKTFRVYLKTDTQSSQEDTYCVVDPNVYSQLEQLSQQRSQVTVSYFSWISSGIKNCAGEDAVIFDVVRTQDIAEREKNALNLIKEYEDNDPSKKADVAEITNIIKQVKGRGATFFEIEQMLRYLGKIK